MFIIDAWLERKDPCLRVIDAEDGRVVMQIEGDRLQQMMDQGDLDPSELMQSRSNLKNLVRPLLLTLVG